MDDIRDLLESQELKAAVDAITALNCKWGQTQSQAGEDNFRSLALGAFRSRKVLEVLLSDDAGYPGKRDVLATGFSAWVLFPHRPEVRITWITHAILEHMDEAERSVGLVKEPWSLQRDIAACYILAGPEFLSDMYNAIGGYEAFTRISSHAILNILHETDVRAVRTVARAMAYLHHGANMYSVDGPFYRPSVNQTVKIFDALRLADNRAREAHPYVGRSLLHKRWRDGKSTLALIYAASRISVSKRRTLLDVMIEALFTYRDYGHLIPTWLGMARYAAQKIFSVMEDTSLTKETNKLLGSAEPIPLSLPKLSSDEKRDIAELFRKRNQMHK